MGVESGKREDSGVEWKARGKQGFSGSGAPQSRVFSAKKPQNRVPSTAKYLNQDVTDQLGLGLGLGLGVRG